MWNRNKESKAENKTTTAATRSFENVQRTEITTVSTFSTVSTTSTFQQNVQGSSLSRNSPARRTMPINLNYQRVYVRPSLDAVPFRPSNNTTLPPSNSYSTQYRQRFNSSPAAPALPQSPSTSSLTNESKLKIKVRKCTRFCDGPGKKVPHYVTRSKRRAKVLIITNIAFDGNESLKRKGAEFDRDNVKKLFKEMNFSISAYDNLRASEMQSKIRQFRKNSDLKNYDISIVVVMSHGSGGGGNDSTVLLGTDEKPVEASWIIDQFNGDNCVYMKNKPKIFIFQCCRGDKKDDMTRVKTDAVVISKPTNERLMADMLVAYSTVPGFVSHRDLYTGSWYMQAVCEVFMDHAHDTDVESMLKMVDEKLAHLRAPMESRQTSTYENRAFKTCYLHPCYYA